MLCYVNCKYKLIIKASINNVSINKYTNIYRKKIYTYIYLLFYIYIIYYYIYIFFYKYNIFFLL